MWVHRNFPRTSPPALRNARRRPRVPPMHYMDKPKSKHPRGVVIGREKRVAVGCELTNREKDIHWPEGFDPSQADLFSHNELVINASCERIWGHIVDATKWPQWYPNSKDVRIDGGDVLKEGIVFHWSTFALP